MEHLILIGPDGMLSFVYDDQLQPLMEAGNRSVKRASRVEPTREGEWMVDLDLVGGPQLGPFRLRGEAIQAEMDWLKSRLMNPAMGEAEDR